MNYKLVPMDKSHLQGIADIERECFSTPWTVPMLEEELNNLCACFIVAEGEDGSVLGYAGLHVAVDEGYIDNIAVQEQYRRQGVGEALLGAFIRFGKEKLAFLTLEVRPSNQPAIQFYMKHGFVQVGRRKNFYSAPKEDALLMTLEFDRNATETAE